MQRPARADHASGHQPRQRERRSDAAADRPAAQRPDAPAAAGQRAGDHAQQHAAVLKPGQLRGRSRRETEHGAGEGFEDQVLRAEGEHRNEHEDRETARGGFLPDLAERFEEAQLRLRRRRRALGDAARALEPPQRHHGDETGDQRDAAADRHQALRRVGIEPAAGQPGRHREADDHHHPDDGGRRRTALCRHALGQQHQHRGAAGADPQPDAEEGERGQREAGVALRGHPGGGDRGQRAARGEHGHAAEDPGRAAPAAVGTESHARPRDLHRVVDRHQQARHQGRQRELDHHHAIERRGGQHDDGAERHLHQTEPHDAEPAERLHHVIRLARRRAGRRH